MYQPWSEEAFASDFDVQSLSPMQRWMYRTLLQKSFVCSTRPFPPDDDSILWKMSGCPSSTVWDQHKEPVKAMFENRIVNGVPVLFRQRLADDWSRLQSIRASKRKGAKERWRRDKQSMHMHTDAEQMYACAVQVGEVSRRNKEKTLNPAAEPAAAIIKPKRSRNPEEQRQNIEARDQRLEKEAEVQKELNAGHNWISERIAELAKAKAM